MPNLTNKQKQQSYAPLFFPMADKLAWSFSRKTKSSFEDLQAVARFAVIEGVDMWDEEKGSLSTLCFHGIRNELMTFTGKAIKHTPTKEGLEQSRSTDPARNAEFKDSVLKLSREAKEVVRILFNGPSEILNIPKTSSACKVKKALRIHLMDQGVQMEHVREVFTEIKGIL